jgi:hypothetical protein
MVGQALPGGKVGLERGLLDIAGKFAVGEEGIAPFTRATKTTIAPLQNRQIGLLGRRFCPTIEVMDADKMSVVTGTVTPHTATKRTVNHTNDASGFRILLHPIAGLDALSKTVRRAVGSGLASFEVIVHNHLSSF